MTAPTSAPPAGWYPDTTPGRLRWFDGVSWTDHTTPEQAEPTTEATSAAATAASEHVPAAAAATVVAYPGHRPVTPWGGSPRDPVHWLIPTGRSAVSIVAGYVALVAVFVWVLGPLALLLGVLGVRAGARGGHGRGRAWFAVVVGVAATLAAAAVGVSMVA